MATAAPVLVNPTSAPHSAEPRSDACHSKKYVILPGQEEEFTAFSEGLEAEFQPEGAYQQFLFRQILHAAWNLERCHAAEAELAIAGLASGSDPLLIETNEAKLRWILRYAAQAERSLAKAVQELRRVQTEILYRRETEIDQTEDSPLAEFKAVAPQLAKENLRAQQTHLTALRAYLEAPPPRRPEPAAATPSDAAKQTKPMAGGFSLGALLRRNAHQR